MSIYIFTKFYSCEFRNLIMQKRREINYTPTQAQIASWIAKITQMYYLWIHSTQPFVMQFNKRTYLALKAKTINRNGQQGQYKNKIDQTLMAKTKVLKFKGPKSK